MDTATRLALAALHIAVAAVLIPTMTKHHPAHLRVTPVRVERMTTMTPATFTKSCHRHDRDEPATLCW